MKEPTRDIDDPGRSASAYCQLEGRGSGPHPGEELERVGDPLGGAGAAGREEDHGRRGGSSGTGAPGRVVATSSNRGRRPLAAPSYQTMPRGSRLTARWRPRRAPARRARRAPTRRSPPARGRSQAPCTGSSAASRRDRWRSRRGSGPRGRCGWAAATPDGPRAPAPGRRSRTARRRRASRRGRARSWPARTRRARGRPETPPGLLGAPDPPERRSGKRRSLDPHAVRC